MRILVITRNLPPLVGGMERLNWHMIDQLAKHADIAVVCPDETVGSLPQSVNYSLSAPLKPLSRFLSFSFIKIIKIARKFNPDIIIAGSGLMTPHAIVASKICGAKSIGYMHGLDVSVEHPVYKSCWRPAIRSLNRVIANSTPTASLLKQIGVAAHKIGIVHPGVAMPHQSSDEQITDFKNRHKLQGYDVLLSVGRLTTRKGLKEFVQHALPYIVQQRPNVLLLVLGDAPHNSILANHQTPAEIMAEARKHGIEGHIHFIGTITDPTELSLAYYSADVHIFPVRTLKGDPEGFGMVAIEAAAHGLPTVAFATGGIVDAVEEGVSGYLVAPDDYNALAAKTVSMLNSSTLQYEMIIQHARKFEWDKFGAQIQIEVNKLT